MIVVLYCKCLICGKKFCVSGVSLVDAQMVAQFEHRLHRESIYVLSDQVVADKHEAREACLVMAEVFKH